MAKDLKPHIGIYGRTNSGKSTLINKLTGQPVAIVSEQAGTTTDPVKKSIEIFGIGPVILIDTAGIDDTSELGQQRVEKTYQTIKEIDCAILVLSDNHFGDPEEELVNHFKDFSVPYIVVHNKADNWPLDVSLQYYLETHYDIKAIDFSARYDDPQPIVEALKKAIPESAYKKTSMLGGIVKPNDVVVLVTPIDDEAPEGRLILPQVMAIRNALDNDCICVVLKETNLQQYFDTMPWPNLVVTDSQAFAMVSKIVPDEVRLTSFSILLARLRGDFENYLKGTPYLSQLKDGDKILMLESCTHEISCGDIGRVKLPALIRKFTGKNIQFDYVAGLSPISNINQYAMAIQCGGCVATRKQLLNRTNLAVKAGIPISNYGMAIAYMTGVFNRATASLRFARNDVTDKDLTSTLNKQIMKFNPEKCRIPDEPNRPFISSEEIWDFINNTKSTPERVREIIQKSLDKNRLTMEETAVLVNTTDPVLVEEIKEGARELKRRVYGNRIVLFAPLYVGNYCVNNCVYCGFRSSNREQVRTTLTDEELVRNVEALEDDGQKRLILVYGESPKYSPEYIAHTVKVTYATKKGKGSIRRVNINAAPLDVEGFRIVKEAGIGTYQIFQETYCPEIYNEYHPINTKKGDYNYRLTAMDRAQQAGIDDNGLGILFGLYDWRYEVLAMIRHTNHLEACFNVGPHTISFPRIKDASGLNIDKKYFVDDETFEKIIAIFRLAVPYTGMILTAREDAEFRARAIEYGISQIDGGTNLQIGDYKYHHEEEEKNSDKQEDQNLHREQFKIGDDRSLGEIIDKLLDHDFIPSFCTACYRLGRTGEHFMEFSVPGFIKRYCTPNAILTLSEYLVDYATPEVAAKGWKCIENNFKNVDPKFLDELKSRIERIKKGERDLYF